jgi:hypothetical protein
MRKWKARYISMTASYDCGIFYADTKEEAEREARAKATAFSQSEKCLIKCQDVTND